MFDCHRNHTVSLLSRLCPDTGLLHYHWTATEQDTVFDFSSNNTCNHVYREYLDEYHRNTSNLHQLMEKCTGIFACRNCFRSVRNIQVNVDKLVTTLKKAFVDRVKCIIDYPFYNPRQLLVV